MDSSYNYYTGKGFGACLEEAIRAGNPNGGTGSDCNNVANHHHHGNTSTSENHNSNASWLPMQKVSVRNIGQVRLPSSLSLEDSRPAPVVDYASFKQTLRRYSLCRTKLRRLFETQQVSRDLFSVEDTEPILAELEGAATKASSARQTIDLWTRGSSYVAMGDAETADCSCDLPGVLRTESRTVHRRTILRRASTLERDNLTRSLAEEIQTISAYYESRLASLEYRVRDWTTRNTRRRSNNPPTNTTDGQYGTVNENNNHNNNHNNNNNDNHCEDDYLHETVRLGHDLLEVLAFCAMNGVVVRQILIRYDAFARSVGGIPLMEFYWKRIFQSTSAKTKRNKKPDLNGYELRRILLHQGVTDLCDLFHRTLVLDAAGSNVETAGDQALGNSDDQHLERTLSVVAERFRVDREELCRVMESAAIDPLSSGIPVSNPAAASEQDSSVLQSLRNSVWLGLYLEDQIGWYLYGTDRDRSKSLKDEMRSLARWKRRSESIWSSHIHFSVRANATYEDDDAGIGGNGCVAILQGDMCLDLECENLAGCGNHCVDESDDNELVYDSTSARGTTVTKTSSASHNNNNNNDSGHDGSSNECSFEDRTDENGVTRQQAFNLFLALAGGFLYCMNYYIVEPSSTMYANALGAQDAAGAILIGMMPIACCSAAIVYSVWTNTVYRQPFLLSCSLMITGNIVYSSAFHYQSLPMALIGRFMTGLGGPKMIVRRYMADTTASSIRTSVNALFGMVVAAGSALGPCCAIILARYNFIIALPGGSELWFNSMTGPGWFMAVLWSIFSVALFAGFREQERIGLYEKLHQEHQEQEASSMHRVSTATDGDCEETIAKRPPVHLNPTLSVGDDSIPAVLSVKSSMSIMWEGEYSVATRSVNSNNGGLWGEWQRASRHFLFPVRICMGLLFAKVFVIETLVSCTSALSKNRYGWTIHEVGALGCFNGFFVIPISILVGKLSMSYQDRYLMVCLLLVGVSGLSLLIDFSDLFPIDGDFSERTYNKNLWWSVGPTQYVIGYFVTYVSIQSFEGIIGSALSKLVPTALATGTFNSGLLATLVDTSGRGCGDLFIALMGFWNIRQLMNLLFIPGVIVLTTCLVVVRRYYDLLAV